MTKQAVPETGAVVQLDPGILLADQNARFGLKQTRIDTLSEDILKTGEVLNPLEIQKLDPPVNGFQFRITHGHYRHAAVAKLNKEQHAGLTLPCRVAEPGDGAQRLKRQLSENLERENLSPMDTAIAIQQALDAGIPKGEVRDIFKRVGGRKGNVVAPASNSFINEMLSFLQFPKEIQNKLHDGRLTVTAGMSLARAPKDKWQAILDRAEADRIAVIEGEEKAEAKLLEGEKKQEEIQAKVAETTTALGKAKDEAAQAREAADRLAAEAAEAFKAAKLAKDDKEKDKAEKAFKAVEAASREANKRVEMTTKAATKLEDQAKKITLVSADQARRLKEAREAAAKKKGAPISKKEVEKAASKEGGPSHVPLTLSAIRAVLSELQGEGVFPKVQLIGKALSDNFAGIGTPALLIKKLGVITGEKKEK